MPWLQKFLLYGVDRKPLGYPSFIHGVRFRNTLIYLVCVGSSHCMTFLSNFKIKQCEKMTYCLSCHQYQKPECPMETQQFSNSFYQKVHQCLNLILFQHSDDFSLNSI